MDGDGGLWVNDDWRDRGKKWEVEEKTGKKKKQEGAKKEEKRTEEEMS